VGVMAVILLILSPLNLILSGSMLSHAATQMLLALFTWLFLRGWSRQSDWRSLALSGLALGAAFSTRPLSGAVIGVVAAGYTAFEVYHRQKEPGILRSVASFAGGVAVGVLPALIDNYLATGSPLRFAYSLVNPEFWTPRAFESGLFYVERLIGQLSAMAFGWGWPWIGGTWWPILALTFAFAAVPFLLGRASRYDWFLLGIVGALLLGYVGFTGSGLHGFGPRYFADVFFAFALLTARGFQELARIKDPVQYSATPRFLATLLFLLLTCGTALSLHFRMSLYRNYNDVDGALEQAIASQAVKKGLILLGEPTYLNWVRAARLMQTDVRADIVFAGNGPENEELVRIYQGWPVYVYDAAGLRPYTR
jgi:hypothetical protein